MRLLAILLIATTSVVATSCYSPALDDCQFKCGSNEQPCPIGSTCMAGFCRTDQTGSCPGSGTDSGSAGDSGTDGTTDPCPAGIPASPPGCTQRFAIGSGCGVMCTATPRSRADAKTACSDATWKLAVLDSAVKLGLPPVTTGTYWVGALRATTTWQWETTGTPSVVQECWASGTPIGGPIGGNNCAVVDSAIERMTNGVACTLAQPYICTYP